MRAARSMISAMSLTERAQNIILSPVTEWPVIAAEPATTTSVITGYLLPMASLGAGATFIATAITLHTVRGAAVGLVSAVLALISAIVFSYVFAYVVAMLAPSFSGANDPVAGMKWGVYGHTPAFIAGLANVFVALPGPGSLLAGAIVLVATVYSLYTLWLGTVPMMQVPADKAAPYAIVALLVNIVAAVILAVVIGLIGAALSAALAGPALVAAPH
jgi:hypothetical protein